MTQTEDYETQLHELRQERDNLHAELVEAKDLLRRIFEAEALPIEDVRSESFALQAELEALFADWEDVEPDLSGNFMKDVLDGTTDETADQLEESKETD